MQSLAQGLSKAQSRNVLKLHSTFLRNLSTIKKEEKQTKITDVLAKIHGVFQSKMTGKHAMSGVAATATVTTTTPLATPAISNVSAADVAEATTNSAMSQELAQIFGEKAVNLNVNVDVPTFEPADHSALTQMGLDYIAQLHEMTGLPYWGVIVLMTVIMRLAVIPVQNFQMKHTALSQFASPLFKQEMDKYKTVSDVAKQKTLREGATKIYEYFGTGPIKSMVGLLSVMPIYITMFFLINTAINDPVLGPDMLMGGIPPFQDLSKVDETYVVPVFAALTTILMFELNSRGQPVTTDMGKYVKWVVRGLALVSIPILGNFPVGLFYYWIPSNILSAMIMSMGRADWYRKYFKLPTMAQVNRVTSNPKLAEKFIESAKKGAPLQGYDLPGLNTISKPSTVQFFQGVNKIEKKSGGAAQVKKAKEEDIIEKATRGAKVL